MATDRERDFFARFQDFNLIESASPLDNFKLLANKHKWSAGSKKWCSKWFACFDSLYSPDPSYNKFFDNFVNFIPDDSVSDLENFNTLAKKRKWGVGSKTWCRNWKACFGTEYTRTQNTTPTPNTPTQYTPTITQYTPSTTQYTSTQYTPTSSQETPTQCTPAQDTTDSQSCDSYDEVLDFKPDPRAALAVDFARLATQTNLAQGTPIGQSRNSCYDKFPGFKPDSHASLADEFARLAKFNGWKKNSDEWRGYRAMFYDEEFTLHFGYFASNLNNWQKFSKILDMPIGSSITQCKKNLKDSRVYFNIVNVVNHMRNPDKVELIRFTDWNKFVAYTMNGHIYPLKAAKGEKFLCQLLQRIFGWSNPKRHQRN
ncbi:uncharacterized protein K452DRAFT_314320 [Aplosporella prunicola CBS 121167]|uniref:Uncharacterized protein n=1 Tax=Aplosporella prunicola CBS 121167 TaxID=1176127 RepID=A0A6A6BWJ9_9PEZI|nr:uncharacterized protein K452DRAFT_314320 [Aplosporella prunicola CBS 121167]KAF2147091.1 hypothetical protein K452DRAFT_314320 [Aplosporella prunicola CBS 121167]